MIKSIGCACAYVRLRTCKHEENKRERQEGPSDEQHTFCRQAASAGTLPLLRRQVPRPDGVSFPPWLRLGLGAYAFRPLLILLVLSRVAQTFFLIYQKKNGRIILYYQSLNNTHSSTLTYTHLMYSLVAVCYAIPL